ncbi:MAG: glycine--tRNA ligase [Patescibacteria group bacterium]|mgnify:CR=1 FL=1
MPIPLEKKMDVLVSLCKRRGFVYPGSEIYGGFAHSWDYGPYGTELKQNIRREWWKKFVQNRDDMVGIETPIIMNPKAWEASGHIQNFSDPLVDCKKCKHRFRADHLLEALDSTRLRCPLCGGELTDSRQFSQMLKTFVGATEDASALAYLRPETAGGMFVAWKNVRDSSRARLPFGIAQIGKAFRNEITPGNFIFRTREFEQMEIEYFVKKEDAPHAFDLWLGEQKTWITDVLKINPLNVVYHEIADADRAFYSARSIDTEYRYPFGLKELYGIANRTDYDLTRHQEYSREDLRWMDPDTGEKILPHVIEPTWGLDRTVLVLLLEHLDVDEADTTTEGEKEPRMVLHLPPRLAPVTVAVLPLVKKDGLPELAKTLVQTLRASDIVTEYDESGTIGKRYRRQDEIGTPWCVTIDQDTKEKGTATIRTRDTMAQERVSLADISQWIVSHV